MTRITYIISTCVAAMVTIVPALVHPAPRLIWNASASVPIGLYRLDRGAAANIGDLAAVSPTGKLAAYLARRHYLPLGLPLLKHVAARRGQRVCRIGDRILIDGREAGIALARDSHGRPLPEWRGCLTLAPKQVFLMNATVRDSFDGRYFGALPLSAIMGRLTPIWTH